MADRVTSIEQLNAACCAGDHIAEPRRGYATEGDSELAGYKRLRVWQLALDFAADCYRLKACFPKAEEYGLTRQLRRASVSISLNIAEGWARNSDKEFARFCDIARGSLHEVDAALELAVRLEYLQRSDLQAVNEAFRIVGSMLLKLTKHLRRP